MIYNLDMVPVFPDMPCLWYWSVSWQTLSLLAMLWLVYSDGTEGSNASSVNSSFLLFFFTISKNNFIFFFCNWWFLR